MKNKQEASNITSQEAILNFKNKVYELFKPVCKPTADWLANFLEKHKWLK